MNLFFFFFLFINKFNNFKYISFEHKFTKTCNNNRALNLKNKKCQERFLGIFPLMVLTIANSIR
jgi:hypothetical protein